MGDDAITNVETCFAAIADTDCLCGTEGASDLNDYSADDDSCDDEVTEADVILINKWLDAAKLTGATGAKLPGFLNADLTALSTGAWTTVSCYADAEAAGAATGFSGCANEYAILRALWDSATIPAATLTAGGLTATVIPDLLFAYESNANSDIWDDFATYFVDGEEFADETFALKDLQDVFCEGGVPAAAADVVTNAADFGGDGLPFVLVMVLEPLISLIFGVNFLQPLLHMVTRACSHWLLIVTLILWMELLLQLSPTPTLMLLVFLALLQVRMVWLCRLRKTLQREECVLKDMIALLLLPPKKSPNQLWTTPRLTAMKRSQMLMLNSSVR